MEKDDDKKAVLREELFDQTIPYYLQKFDDAAQSGYLCLERVGKFV